MTTSQKPMRGMTLNRTHPLAKGLVGCWIFNEATGNKVFNLSGNGNNGTLINNADWVPNGLEFPTDGGTDRVDLGLIGSGNDLSGVPTGEITIVSEVYVGSATPNNDYARIFDKSDGGGAANGWMLFWDAAGTANRFYVQVAGNALEVRTTNLSRPSVYTVAAVLKSGDNHIYVNGVENTDLGGSSAFTFPSTTTNAAIGNWNHTTDRQWNGYISYVYIYNRALSSAEIKTLNAKPYIMFERPVNPAILYYDVPSGTYPMWYYNMLRRRR